ncbi:MULTISPECIES: hypothetical protein [Lactobacillus]|uniref:DUF1049 domain-containing protein n=1 Tax=Lactobacillus xujianguonis TaxID=2495899 RepID=A0A437SVE0_9LACO|nr:MULTISPECIES: hypothetical protein [Lactobacillus]RVU70888.1 hypothetical protein EJK17_04855 [Lactobacillus xujianguonis]RVU73765.1 hypothetical protein EJK20_06570 [Lactobacillus xujianguonis]
MKKKVLRFLGCFLISLIGTWLILTLGILAKVGPERLVRLFTSENLPIVIGVYLFAGVVCGLCLGGMLYFIVREMKSK